ncbi:MAG: hypothetical protein VX199_07970 [Chloroflexota bacterium]|nr:hypothetical protein [Chloroflexota bacterium]
MTRQKAIDAKCYDCIYDEFADGIWRMQVEQCEITDCAQYPYRPVSRSKASSEADSAAVQPHYAPIGQGVMLWGQERI